MVNIAAKQKTLHVVRLNGRDRMLLLKIFSVPVKHASSKFRSLRDVGNIWLLLRRKTTLCHVYTKAYITTTKTCLYRRRGSAVVLEKEIRYESDQYITQHVSLTRQYLTS